MGDAGKSQSGVERSDMDARRAAVLGREVNRSEVQAIDIERDHCSLDKSQDNERRKAVLGDFAQDQSTPLNDKGRER